jgi:hypothetical protein
MAIVGNVGLTVALQLLDRNFDGDQVPRSALFRQHLISKSRALSLVIARQWKFPGAVLEAQQELIGAEDMQGLSKLAGILFLSDKLAKLHILAAQGRFTGDVADIVRASRSDLSVNYATCYQRLSA